jgi:hypothetical protein
VVALCPTELDAKYKKDSEEMETQFNRVLKLMADEIRQG